MPVELGEIHDGKRDGAHRYQLSSHATYDFFTGKTPEQTQVIAGVIGQTILCFFFDQEGNILRKQSFALPNAVNRELMSKYPDVEYPELESLMQNLKIEECPILVRRFYDSEYDVGINDLPSFCLDYLRDATAFLSPTNEAARKNEALELDELIQRWSRDGTFVFNWTNDFYVNRLGEVVSS
jgi:hypothetical protein